jgi:hypothetical protein
MDRLEDRRRVGGRSLRAERGQVAAELAVLGAARGDFDTGPPLSAIFDVAGWRSVSAGGHSTQLSGGRPECTGAALRRLAMSCFEGRKKRTPVWGS